MRLTDKRYTLKGSHKKTDFTYYNGILSVNGKNYSKHEIIILTEIANLLEHEDHPLRSHMKIHKVTDGFFKDYESVNLDDQDDETENPDQTH